MGRVEAARVCYAIVERVGLKVGISAVVSTLATAAMEPYRISGRLSTQRASVYRPQPVLSPPFTANYMAHRVKQVYGFEVQKTADSGL